nr:hypothetical protein [Burkholderiales bacterium]
ATMSDAEYRVTRAIERWEEQAAFYRWLKDEPVLQFIRVEVERLQRRRDAYAAVRLGSLRHTNSSIIKRAAGERWGGSNYDKDGNII